MTTNLLAHADGISTYWSADGTSHASPLCPAAADVTTSPEAIASGWLCEVCIAVDVMGVSTRVAADLDAADRQQDRPTGTGSGSGSSSSTRTNKFAGKCDRCGGRVEAEAGHLVRAGGGWAVVHVGDCPARMVVAEPARRNRYAGTCRRCGQHVPAEAGLLVGERGAWGVEHDGDCPPASDVVDVPAASDVPAARREHAKGDVHVIDGDYFRVHVSQHSGYFYAAVWNGEKFVGPRYDERAKGALKRMTDATLATAEQAAAFGAMHHACVFCSTAIDTPESEAVGYGPTCAAKRGLPWGEK